MANPQLKPKGLSKGQRRTLKKARVKKMRQHRFRKMSSKQKSSFKKVVRAAHRGRAITRRSKSYKMSLKKGGLAASHSPEVVNSIIEVAIETKDLSLGRALLQLDPALTSSENGNYTLGIIGAVLESDLKTAFVDAEVIEEKSMLYFDRTDKDITEDLGKILGAFGKVEILAKPGDSIAENEVSDLYLVSVTPTDEQVESNLASYFTKEEEAELVEVVESLDASNEQA